MVWKPDVVETSRNVHLKVILRKTPSNGGYRVSNDYLFLQKGILVAGLVCMQLTPWPVGQWGSLEILKLPRLLLRQRIALQKLIELLRTTPSQLIDQSEL